MREFVIYSRKGPTGEFNIKDLPGSGRVDLIARSIISAMWISHKLRDNKIHIVLNGPPEPPKAFTVTSSIKRVSPDERSIGIWMNKILQGKSNPGMSIAKKSFQDVIREKHSEGKNIFVLHESGEKIENIAKEDFENAVFVIGDNLGIPENDEKFALRYGRKVSIGPKSYLASQCITFINIFLDKLQI